MPAVRSSKKRSVPLGKVVHCKKEPFDVYIGRPGPWGNPYAIGVDGNRLACITRHRIWLWNQIKSGAIRVEDVAALHGKTLGCWCNKGQPCHGYTLLRAAKWAVIHLKKNATEEL